MLDSPISLSGPIPAQICNIEIRFGLIPLLLKSCTVSVSALYMF